MKHSWFVIFRTILANLLGIGLGFITAQKASNLMEAGILVMIGGAIVNPVLACLITARCWLLVATTPVVSSALILLGILYNHQHKYEGMVLTTFLKNHVSLSAILGVTILCIPAFITAAVFYYFKSKHAEVVSSKI